ncbi:cytidine deaminase [bacterium]|nr:cytidine deaminase [bacterium]MDA7934687.1 cytidine deaminase [Akkermansiaceae bacterium]MDB4370202.1 cytidine deaminase [Akkermansiaceae bacterium]
MSDELLIEAAMAARANCYCPYSSFPVSAALLAESGKIYTGVNVENASYGLTICAERVAVGSAITAGERKFEKLVVVVRGGGSPCGACRQVLNEFAPELPVLMVDELGRVSSETTLAGLLPRAFGPQSL